MIHSAIKTMKFLGPHLLNMLQDAVGKWNHEIPDEMIDEANNQYKLLISKVPFDYNAVDLRSVDIKPDDFLDLFLQARDWIKRKYESVIRECVRALVFEKEIEPFELMKHQLAFSAWLSMGGNFKGDKIVEDAILCVQRMNPNRLIAPSGTLILRDLVPVFHVNPSDRMLAEMFSKLGKMYEFRNHTKFIPGFMRLSGGRAPDIEVLELKPLNMHLGIDVLEDAYGVTLKKLSNWDLMTLDCDINWLKEDPNLSQNGIMNKILGSSITSLSTVISDMLVWMCLQFDEIKDLDARLSVVRSGMWDSVDDIVDFVVPERLYGGANRMQRGKRLLTRDFEKLEMLLDLYQLAMRFCPVEDPATNLKVESGGI